MADKKEKLVGKVTHYYDKLGVAIVELTGGISVGDVLHYKGATTDFEDEVASIQVEHEAVKTAKKGDIVGIRVAEKVRGGEEVYKK